MITHIRQKLAILQNRAPFEKETAQYMDYLEKLDWIVMNLNLDGRRLKRQDVERVLRGEIILGGSVGEHVIIDRLGEMREEVYQEEGLSFLKGDLRRTNPPIIEYDYQPPIFTEIGPMLSQLMEYIGNEDELEDEFMKAAVIHNRFIEIFPYEKENPLKARALMEYYLVNKGLPMVYLNISEEKYNQWIITYLRTKSSKELRDYLEEETIKRLEFFVELTRKE